MSLFGNLLELLGQLALIALLATLVFWVLAGIALSAMTGHPRWVGAATGLLPGIGALGLTVHWVAVRRPRGTSTGPRRAEPWSSGWLRALGVGPAAVFAVALGVALVQEDTRVRILDQASFGLSIGELGLGFLGVVSVLVLAACAAICWRRPSVLAAVAAAWIGAWWMVWGAGILLVGDALRTLVAATGDLGGAVASVQVGSSWAVVGVLGSLAVAWSVLVLVFAARPTGVGATGWPAAPVGSTRNPSLTSPLGSPPVSAIGAPTPGVQQWWEQPGTTNPGTAWPPTPGPVDPFGRPRDPFSQNR